MAREADNVDERNGRDIVKAIEGRYIGGGRDTSAPTAVQLILLIYMMN